MYTLKSIARRGTPLAALVAIVAATVMPSAAVFADSLNPLTERSLLLSSSAPGFQDTDGSGNSNNTPNAIGENYAPAGSGPNGKKSGETFSFKMSSDNATIKAYTLQYCTTAAGLCQAPGNNSGSTTTSNRLANDGAGGGWENGTSDFDVTGTFTQDAAATDAASVAAGKFQILVDGQPSAASDWTLTTSNWEDQDFDLQAGEGLTGKNNLLTLRSATGDTIPTGKKVEIVFKPSESIFITNPGSKAFFVKINTYSDGAASHQLPDTNANIVDGGVTVANVMTDSIHITTKVLETMAFSVGTRNRDTQVLNCGSDFGTAQQPAGCEAATGAVHGKCDAMQNVNNNRLDLGNPNAENSLETGKAWDAYSYWRLSSNSSGGATVYYSGNTLQNTVGDFIQDMPSESASTPGTEQFGLGFVDAGTNSGADALASDYTGATPRSFPFKTLSTQTAAPYDTLASQPISQAYDEATGTIDNGTGGPGVAKFKFLKSSLTTPEPIAQENDQVISCATAKMRYVGNIGADTPAGVYTTKINYLAAPQY